MLLRERWSAERCSGTLPTRTREIQEKCDAVFRPELRKNKQIERLRGSKTQYTTQVWRKRFGQAVVHASSAFLG